MRAKWATFLLVIQRYFVICIFIYLHLHFKRISNNFKLLLLMWTFKYKLLDTTYSILYFFFQTGTTTTVELSPIFKIFLKLKPHFKLPLVIWPFKNQLVHNTTISAVIHYLFNLIFLFSNRINNNSRMKSYQKRPEWPEFIE